MTFEDIEKLTSQMETGKIEFKETTGQLERGMETICAFLNGMGGTLLFGINDKGKIIGQELSDKTKREIAEAIRRIEPFATIEVSYTAIPDANKSIITLYVEEQRYMRPFSYKGRAYQRIESVTSVMSQEKYNLLLMQRGGKYGWESMSNTDLHISDLNENAIIGAVRAGINSGRLPETTIREEIPAILEKFALLHNGKLNNAAAVLFGRNFYDYPQCLLRLARFKGTNKEEFVDNQRVQGNIYDLLDAAMSFFFKHLSLSGKIEGLYREEELSIPYKALRECCINAFSHRFYHHPGSSVSIAIYDDRVEVTNSGTFPADMSIERLLSAHDSQPQNPIIANVLYKSKILESWGRGIGLMVSECLRIGLPTPEFHTDGAFVWVIFRYTPAVQIFDKYPTSTDQVTDQVTDQATDQVISLANAIGNKSLSAKEIMAQLGLNHRPSFRTTYLHPALNGGYIVPLYPEQPSNPKQKYRLTEKGKTLLI